jgi:hypothetical protein
VRYALMLASAGLLASCLPQEPVTPHTSACEAACSTLRALECPWAAPTPAGATCEQRCEKREKQGYDTGHPECVASATTCLEADKMSSEGCTQ